MLRELLDLGEGIEIAEFSALSVVNYQSKVIALTRALRDAAIRNLVVGLDVRRTENRLRDPGKSCLSRARSCCEVKDRGLREQWHLTFFLDVGDERARQGDHDSQRYVG